MIHWKSGIWLILILVIPCMTLAQTNGAGNVTTVYTTWFPYTFENEKGEAKGFENEIFRSVMRTLGFGVTFIRRPWKRCLRMLQDGEVDALVSLLLVEEREAYTIYADEDISISRTLLFTHADSAIPFSGHFESLKPFSIGTTRGFSYGGDFDGATYLDKEEVNEQSAIIKKVVAKRTDLGIGNQLVIIGLAKQLGQLNKIRFLEPPVHTQKLYVGFARVRDLGQMAKSFTEALVRFKQSKQYRNILSKYGISAEDMKSD